MATNGFIGFKLNNEIKGWNNHFDSYPHGLGIDIIEHTYKYTQEQIKDFFTKRLELLPINPRYLFRTSTVNVFNYDWLKDKVSVYDGGDFYKNGYKCKFSYIFDLNAKEKTILLYTGLENSPSKGIEDWYYQDEFGKVYMKYCGKLTYEKTIEEIIADMYIKFGSNISTYKHLQDLDILKETVKFLKKDFPSLIDKLKRADSSSPVIRFASYMLISELERFQDLSKSSDPENKKENQ
jgi:hypothetical protein